jgi:hypothetical protein
MVNEDDYDLVSDSLPYQFCSFIHNSDLFKSLSIFFFELEKEELINIIKEKEELINIIKEKEELINIIKEKEATVEIDDPTSFYISVFDDNLPS